MAKRRTEPKKTTALVPKNRSAPGVLKLAVEIRDLIETTRNHVSMTANLALVSLYWNAGRIIAQDIQKNEKRAEYGAELMEQLAVILTRDYGRGYSVHNLRDMKRFFEGFVIRQLLAAESIVAPIRSTLSNESQIRQPLAAESPPAETFPTGSVASSERITIDFRKHFRLGWTHYRMLLSISDPMQRRFYLEQAAGQRWSKRELRRQMDLYLAWLKEHDWRPGENEPVGLILCTSARRQHVELLLRHGPHKMKVAEYRTHLPDKHVLEERLKMYSRLLQDRDRESGGRPADR
jgi:predicted nuclease of restriction endonuclease-like (RecB) superfamily